MRSLGVKGLTPMNDKHPTSPYSIQSPLNKNHYDHGNKGNDR